MFLVVNSEAEIKDFVIARSNLFDVLNSSTHHCVIVGEERKTKNPNMYFADNEATAQTILKKQWLFHEYEQGFHTGSPQRMNRALSTWKDAFNTEFFDEYYERVMCYSGSS